MIGIVNPPYPGLTCARTRVNALVQKFEIKKRGGITILQSRSGPIRGRQPVTDDEHGDLGPILARVPNLLCREIVRFQSLHLCRPVDAPLFALIRLLEIVSSDGARCGKSGHGHEEPRVVSTTARLRCADKVGREAFDFLTVEVVNVQFIFDLFAKSRLIRNPFYWNGFFFVEKRERRTLCRYVTTKLSPIMMTRDSHDNS